MIDATASQLDLSARQMELLFRRAGDHLRLAQLSAYGVSWLHPSIPSGLFAVMAAGRRLDAANLVFDRVQEDPTGPEIRHVTLFFQGSGIGLVWSRASTASVRPSVCSKPLSRWA